MTTEQHDPRTVSTCTITWSEDAASGRGYLQAAFDDGGTHECEPQVPPRMLRRLTPTGAAHHGPPFFFPWTGEPITAKSDSDVIAHFVAGYLSLEVLDVEHDGEIVHATMRQY